MSIKVVYFDIGGVIAKCDLEQYAPMAASLFKTSEDALRKEVRARVPLLETGKLDSNGFWHGVGSALQTQGTGILPSSDVYKGLWLKILKSHLKLDLNLLKLCWSLQAKGLVVGALSNTIEEHADHLAQIGTYQPFKPCVLSCIVGLRKPDHSIYKLAAKKAAKGIKECLLIDDAEENISSARAAGMQAHHYRDIPTLLQDLNKLKLL
jgi:epoxide hydrolase-like predicted phosphatase